MAKGTKQDQQFKENAVRYRLAHPELSLQKAAENLGISDSVLKTWSRAAREHEENVPTRGSRDYSSDEVKEIARLQRELRDTKDALEILKKAIRILGNDLTPKSQTKLMATQLMRSESCIVQDSVLFVCS